MQVAGIKKQWVGREFDTAEFEVTAADIVGFSQAVGETDPRFLDPAHPDFQAPPTFSSRFVSRRILPETFPKMGLGGTGKKFAVLERLEFVCGLGAQVVVTNQGLHTFEERIVLHHHDLGVKDPGFFLACPLEYTLAERIETLHHIVYRLV